MPVTPKTYNNILSKGLQSALNSTAIEDGKLRYTTDTANVYLDIAVSGTTPVRVKISDIIQGMTEEEISEIIAPLPKLYLASDTCRLYVHHDTKGWVDVSGAKLQATTKPNVNQSIWFSEDTEEQPSYDTSFTYNSSTKVLAVDNVAVENVSADLVSADAVSTSEIQVDGMKITTSTDAQGNKITDFEFIQESND